MCLFAYRRLYEQLLLYLIEGGIVNRKDGDLILIKKQGWGRNSVTLTAKTQM